MEWNNVQSYLFIWSHNFLSNYMGKVDILILPFDLGLELPLMEKLCTALREPLNDVTQLLTLT